MQEFKVLGSDEVPSSLHTDNFPPEIQSLETTKLHGMHRAGAFRSGALDLFSAYCKDARHLTNVLLDVLPGRSRALRVLKYSDHC